MKYGYLNVETAIARGLDPVRTRVFLDGVDITTEKVQSLDDEMGYVEVFVRVDGKIQVGADGRLLLERRFGVVSVTFDEEVKG